MTFNTNIANALIIALTALNATLTAKEREKKIVNYLTFSERGDKDINDFIIELEKVFTINRMPNNRKYLVVTSCLKGIVANFYDRLAEIMR